jgi:Fe-S cluster biogenesis protein NfuA
MGEPPSSGTGLADVDIEQRLARLDEVLGQLEHIPGRTAELALEAVETLTEVYGEALGRVVTASASRPGLLAAYTGDELLRHLLLLHRLHPDPVEARVARAVDDLAPQLRSQGASAEFNGVRDGVAYVTVSSGSCGSCGTNGELSDLVRQHVATMAPELAGVEISAPPRVAALIPVGALLRPPALPDRSGREAGIAARLPLRAPARGSGLRGPR